jgi:Na+-translocating ferredoxin:NAD+ oxidoreductase RnfG subunit
VRTVSEALLVALTPEGTVRSVRLLAFHEPEEYRPPSRWLAQFEGAHLGPGLRLGRDVHTIAGATLTSRAATRAVRRALVLHRLLVTPQADRKE